MRFVTLIVIFVLSSSCGVKLTNFDIQDQTKEVRIAEDASIRAVCLQWIEGQEPRRQYAWKCVDISELRKILFPKAGVW